MDAKSGYWMVQLNRESLLLMTFNKPKTAQSNNLNFNPNKIEFKMKESKFFVQLLTPEGMSINQKKVNAMGKMDPPQSKKELGSF